MKRHIHVSYSNDDFFSVVFFTNPFLTLTLTLTQPPPPQKKKEENQRINLDQVVKQVKTIIQG